MTNYVDDTILIITPIKLALNNNVAALNVNMICLRTNVSGGVQLLYINTENTTGYRSFFK
jgi:hypothetical protein